MHLKRAFTLIELLVVIAIIAILAAILFPVFAQAKVAAKKTAAISNLKQNALAVLMYNESYDDTFAQSAYNSAPNSNGQLPAAGAQVYSAFDAIMPYTKNKDIFLSPGEPDAILWKNILQTLGMTSSTNIEKAGFAFNFALFEDPAVLPTLGELDPVRSFNELEAPVDTVMFYDSKYTAQGQTVPNVPAGYQGSPLYRTPPGPFNRYNFAGRSRYAGGLVVNFADGRAKVVKDVAKLVGVGDDLNTTAIESINCYNLPLDLNGIPGLVGEPRD